MVRRVWHGGGAAGSFLADADRAALGLGTVPAIFTRVVRDCLDAGIVSGDVVHMDATLIRADVSLGALAEPHPDAVDLANPDQENRLSRTSGKFRKLCVTDPDATMTTGSRQPLLPSCKQHTSVDHRAGVIVDIAEVTGQAADAGRMTARLDALATTLSRSPGTITADRSHGIGRVSEALTDRDICAVIAPRPSTRQAKGFPLWNAFATTRCATWFGTHEKGDDPRLGNQDGPMVPRRHDACRACPLRACCIPDTAASRALPHP